MERDVEIAGLKELMLQRFDGTDERLDFLTQQVMQTNGRLRTAEGSIADSRPRIQTLERDMRDVRRVVQEFGEEVKTGLQWMRDQIAGMSRSVAEKANAVAAGVTGENRGIRLWDVTVFVAGILATVGVLKFLGAI